MNVLTCTKHTHIHKHTHEPFVSYKNVITQLIFEPRYAPSLHSIGSRLMENISKFLIFPPINGQHWNHHQNHNETQNNRIWLKFYISSCAFFSPLNLSFYNVDVVAIALDGKIYLVLWFMLFSCSQPCFIPYKHLFSFFFFFGFCRSLLVYDFAYDQRNLRFTTLVLTGWLTVETGMLAWFGLI